MSTRRFFSLLALFTLVAGLDNSTRASTIVFTSQAAFQAALKAGSYTETFDSLGPPFSNITTPHTFTGSGFTYTANATSGLFAVGNSPADIWLSDNRPIDPIVFTFTGGAANAVGGFFFTTHGNGTNDGVSTTTLLVQTNDGTSSVVGINSTPTSNFIGFISTVPITTLTVSGTSSDFSTINNLTVGLSADVPEIDGGTAAGALTLLGLGVTMLRNRRSK